MGLTLRPGREFHSAAQAVLAEERARLATLLTGAHELVLVGGSSLPDALTRGDIDLHLRVPAADFDRTVAVLRAIYPVVHPEIWQDSLATFTVPAALPAGIAVTPIGSGHDVRFRCGWALLAADPALVEAYNAMKLRCRDSPEAYEREKSAFFDMLIRRADGSGGDCR